MTEEPVPPRCRPYRPFPQCLLKWGVGPQKCLWMRSMLCFDKLQPTNDVRTWKPINSKLQTYLDWQHTYRVFNNFEWRQLPDHDETTRRSFCIYKWTQTLRGRCVNIEPIFKNVMTSIFAMGERTSRIRLHEVFKQSYHRHCSPTIFKENWIEKTVNLMSIITNQHDIFTFFLSLPFLFSSPQFLQSITPSTFNPTQIRILTPIAHVFHLPYQAPSDSPT